MTHIARVAAVISIFFCCACPDARTLVGWWLAAAYVRKEKASYAIRARVAAALCCLLLPRLIVPVMSTRGRAAHIRKALAEFTVVVVLERVASWPAAGVGTMRVQGSERLSGALTTLAGMICHSSSLSSDEGGRGGGEEGG